MNRTTDVEGIGSDMLGRNEDIYSCIASNVVSNSTNTSILKGMYAQGFSLSLSEVEYYSILKTCKVTEPDTLHISESGVESAIRRSHSDWLYVVYYSYGDTDRNESVPASSTSSLITGLTINITYNFSMEATSEHLPGESDSYFCA